MLTQTIAMTVTGRTVRELELARAEALQKINENRPDSRHRTASGKYDFVVVTKGVVLPANAITKDAKSLAAALAARSITPEIMATFIAQTFQLGAEHTSGITNLEQICQILIDECGGVETEDAREDTKERVLLMLVGGAAIVDELQF